MLLATLKRPRKLIFSILKPNFCSGGTTQTESNSRAISCKITISFDEISIFRCASISSTHDDQIFGQVTRLWVWPTGTTQTESNSRAISYRTGVSQPTLPLDNLYQFLQLPLLALWRLTPSRLTLQIQTIPRYVFSWCSWFMVHVLFLDTLTCKGHENSHGEIL